MFDNQSGMPVFSTTVTKHFILVLLAAVLTATAYRYVNLATADEIDIALSSTTIDHLAFKDAPVGVAVSAILGALHQQHPELGRIRIVSHRFTLSDGTSVDLLKCCRVSCDLRQVRASRAIRHIGVDSDVGFRHEIRHGSVHFFQHTGCIIFTPPTFSEYLSDRIDDLRRTAMWLVEMIIP